MKKVNTLLTAFIIVIILLAAEIAIVKSVSGYESKASVVYAKCHIPEGTVIEESMLEVREIELSYMHKQSVRDKTAITGKKSSAEIYEGEMILMPEILENDTRNIKIIGEDNRLFSIELKGDQANGWLVEAEQFVDIIFIPSRQLCDDELFKNMMESIVENYEQEERGLNLKCVISDTVWIIGKIRIAAVIDDSGNILETGEYKNKPRYVSLEVNQRQAHFLAYAKSSGRLELSIISGG